METSHIELIGLALQTLIFLGGGWAMVIRNDSTTNNLKEEIAEMNEEMKKLAEVITIQAVQTSRIDNLSTQVTLLQRNYEDLRRGNGWVTGRKGVDREY